MSDPVSTKISPVKLLGVLVAALTALKFPATYTDPVTLTEIACPFSGQDVFEQVKVFDFQDIGKAFEELFAYKNRVAFVVHTDQSQNVEMQGRSMAFFFKDTFTVLCADRSHVDRQLALTGNTVTPGVLFISHVMVTSLIGEIAAGFICETQGGELFAMKGGDRDQLWGRVGWRQEFRLHGGPELRSLSPQAAVTFARS